MKLFVSVLLTLILEPVVGASQADIKANDLIAKNYLSGCVRMLEATLAVDPKAKLERFGGKNCADAPVPKDFKLAPNPKIARSSIVVDLKKGSYQITVWTKLGHVWRMDSDLQVKRLK